MAKRFIQTLISSFAFLFCVYLVSVQVPGLMKGDWTLLGVLAYWVIAATLLLIRRPSNEESTRPMHWVIAVGVCFVSLLFIPEKTHISALMWVAVPLQIFSLWALLLALLSLGRSFGIIAARREIKTGGLYRFVRHPIYASDFFLGVSTLLMHLSWHNTLVLLTVTACQILRIQEEEKVLSGDSTYVDYKDEVHFRLIPGVY